MTNDKIAILGVPIDNVTTEEAADAVINLIASYHIDQKPRYVCTVNTDFLVNIYGWGFASATDPKLLHILRNSSIATADGMPLVWLSKILNCGLKERVTGADLVPKVVEKIAKKNMSVFLLGGEDDVVNRTSQLLQERYPGLRIAGMATPQIRISSPDEQLEAALVEQINQAKPDLLLIGLGNPKQEIWFDRVKSRLKVPVSIGVGGVFNFIAGTISRAPRWMQRSGLEWVHRLFHDPKRLWKRYLKDFFKFLFIATPLILFHKLNRLMARIYPNTTSIIFQNKIDEPTVILPKQLDQQGCSLVQNSLKEAFQHDVVILDFSQVGYLDCHGCSLLIDTWKRSRELKKEIHGVGPNSDVRFMMMLHRIWDVVKDDLHLNTDKKI